MSEEVKDLKKRLLSIIQMQINGDISQVDAKELGEVVDMFKDFAEAEYYCSVTDAMEKSSDVEKQHYMSMYAPETTARYYTEPYPYKMDDWRDMEYKRDLDRKAHGRMYFTELPMVDGRNNNDGMDKGDRDYREGKSGTSRKWYMEAKETGKNTAHELEKYMNDLSSDLTEMINKMDQTDKNILREKLATLVNKM